MDKFKAALDSGKWKAEGRRRAGRGQQDRRARHAAFFINGKFVGAQPFEAFKAKIDEELKNADALIKKGVQRGQVYDALMKTAKTEVAAAPRRGAGAAAGAGHQGLQGRARATRRRRARRRAGRRSSSSPTSSARSARASSRRSSRSRRSTRARCASSFSNYPLPFHNNAMPAAEAARRRTRRASSGRCTTSCSRTSRRSIARPSRSTRRSSASTWTSSRRTSTREVQGGGRTRTCSTQGLGAGVIGTPTFFINGRKISGAMPFETFEGDRRGAEEEAKVSAEAIGR